MNLLQKAMFRSFALFLLFYSATANAQQHKINPRDTVIPDTSRLIKINVMPMDTPSHHKMPVVDPLQPDTVKSPEAIPNKREF